MLSNRFVSLYKTTGLGLLVLTLAGIRMELARADEQIRTSGSSSLPTPQDENTSTGLYPPGDGIAIG
jgi:hypothetical protein